MMTSTATSNTVVAGSRSRSTLLVAIVLAFGAGLLVGWLIGSGGSWGSQIPQAVYAVELGQAPEQGPATAGVTVVIFTDFRCPFCRRAAVMMKDLESRFGQDVRFVFKHHPMTALHPDAPLAHEAAAAAAAQGKFWPFHDRVFAHRGPLAREDIEAFASEVGLDMTRFRKDLDQGSMRGIVEGDTEQGDALGVQGTPTFFVNGRRIEGADEDLIVRVIRFELRHAKELVEAGVPAERVYETIMKDAMRPVGPEKSLAPTPAPIKLKPEASSAPSPDDPDSIFKVELGNSTVLGNSDAPVTIVLYLDYECAFSASANETARKLLKQYPDKIRLVFKNNPQPRHEGAVLAAEAVLAAGAQGKFIEMHDLLFADRAAHSRSNLEKYAKQLGLDIALFKKAIDEHLFLPIILQEQEVARSLDATSTPTYFVNGRKLKGNQPIETIEQAIAKSLDEALTLISKGVQPTALYDTIISKGITSVTPAPPGPANPAIPF